MKNHFKTPEDCPAYCFYKADEDVKYLLHNPTEKLTEIERHELNNTLIDLKEWFSIAYNEKAHAQNLSDLRKKMTLEFKLIVLNDLLKTIEVINTDKISEFLNDKNLGLLKEHCKKYSLAFMDYKKDMESQIKRNIKGVTNDYKRTLGKFDDRNVSFNYMRTCINVLRNLKLSRDPLKISLVEWVEMLKLANES